MSRARLRRLPWTDAARNPGPALRVRRLLAGAAKRAAILGTDLPDVKMSLDSLAGLEEAMRHFYIKAKVEQSLGPNADWRGGRRSNAPGRGAGEEIAPYKHCRLPSSNKTKVIFIVLC